MNSVVGELVAATNAPVVCAATVGGLIQVWNLTSEEKIGEFAGLFAGGARNLALHPEANLVVTGVSKPNGSIAAYSITDGKLVWLRIPGKLNAIPG